MKQTWRLYNCRQHICIVLIFLTNIGFHVKSLNAVASRAKEVSDDDHSWFTEIAKAEGISGHRKSHPSSLRFNRMYNLLMMTLISTELILCNGSLLLRQALWVNEATQGAEQHISKCVVSINEAQSKNTCYLHLRIFSLNLTSAIGRCATEFLSIENEKHHRLAEICGMNRRKDGKDDFCG